MKIINTDVRGWKHEQGQYITGEGLVLSKKQVKEQCEYSAVPTTLVNIDERLGLDVALQVLRATSTGIERLLVTDDEKQVLSVLDPRSRFTHDDEFHSLIENIKNKGYEDVKTPTPAVAFELRSRPLQTTRILYWGTSSVAALSWSEWHREECIALRLFSDWPAPMECW